MGTTVLIVEDEILVAFQLEDILSDAGHNVVGIIADSEALAGIDDPPQVALVDLNLRDGPTGPSIARRLAEAFGTKIVYVTANPAQIGEPAPTAVGVVQKPFSQAAILAAVAMASEPQSRSRRAASQSQRDNDVEGIFAATRRPLGSQR